MTDSLEKEIQNEIVYFYRKEFAPLGKNLLQVQQTLSFKSRPKWRRETIAELLPLKVYPVTLMAVCTKVYTYNVVFSLQFVQM